MSAIRYSGEVRIRVTYLEQNWTIGRSKGEYRCHVVGPTSRITVYVGEKLEHGSGIGVDSPAMFDDVARAALAFADYEGFGDSERCAWDRELTERHVGRSIAKAWPSEKANVNDAL